MSLGLFIFVASLFDSFLTNEGLFDFRPHAIFLGFLGLKASSSVSCIEDGDFAGFFYLIVMRATANAL
jgi:hypothetical protein